MKKIFFILFLMVSFGLIADTLSVSDPDAPPKVGARKNIVIAEGDTVEMDIAGNDMDVIVEGVLNGDIALLKGYMHIFPGGVVNGDIALAMTDADIDSGAVINGDMAIFMGDVDINDDASINGDVSRFAMKKGWMDIFNIESDKKMWYLPFLSFIGRILILSFVVFVGRNAVLKSGEYIKERKGKVILWGVLFILFFVPLILTLILTVVGIALLPILFIIYIIVAIVGEAIGSLYLGSMFFNGDLYKNPYLLIILGSLIPFVFEFVSPYIPGMWGAASTVIAGIINIGIVIVGSGGYIEYWVCRKKGC